MSTIVRVGGGGFSRKINADTTSTVKGSYTFSRNCDVAIILMVWYRYYSNPVPAYTADGIELELLLDHTYLPTNDRWAHKVFIARNVPAGASITMSGTSVWDLKVATIDNPLTSMGIIANDTSNTSQITNTVSEDTPCAIYFCLHARYKGRPLDFITQSEGSCITLARSYKSSDNEQTICTLLLEDNASAGKTITLEGNPQSVNIIRLN